MNRKIISFAHQGKLIPIEIIYKNNKNMYMRLKDNQIVLTCPLHFSEKFILSFIEKNISQFVKNIEIKKSLHFIDFQNQELFLFNGKLKFKVLFSQVESVKLINNNLYVFNSCNSEEQTKIQINNFLNEQLNNYLKQKVLELEKQWGFAKHEIKIVKSSSFWGRNKTKSKLLEFNSLLIFYSFWIIDYVIVHELAHDLEQNHSKNFWNIVQQIYPLYKEAILKLKK